MGFRQSNVSGTTQSSSTYRLRQSAFDTSTAVILLFESFSCRWQSSSLKRFMFELRPQRQATSQAVSPAFSYWASHTGLGSKLNTANRRTLQTTTV